MREGALAAIPDDAANLFSVSLDAIVPQGTRIGVAVSGGPDSVALLLLAGRTRPGDIVAATVDHGLRKESRGEAEQVAAICDRLGIEHEILAVDWPEKPTTAIQEQARLARYRALAEWGDRQGVTHLLTAHHADDQAETLLMRLARGSGLTGLSGMRPVTRVPGSTMLLVRPLLAWPKAVLVDLCAKAGIAPAADPSNDDDRFERVRVRKAMATMDCLPPLALTQSAANLADADLALIWVTEREWQRVASESADAISLDPSGLPRELLRRLVLRALGKLATEGAGEPVRGPSLNQLLATLAKGGQATLKGVRCSGGERWTFAKAPPRKGRATGG